MSDGSLNVTQIHVDRYKYGMYMKTSDQQLQSCVTLDHTTTPFHACERHNRCSAVDAPPYTPGLVYVNPVDMDKRSWHTYMSTTREELQAGLPLTNLVSVSTSFPPFNNLLQDGPPGETFATP